MFAIWTFEQLFIMVLLLIIIFLAGWCMILDDRIDQLRGYIRRRNAENTSDFDQWKI